MTDEAVRTRLLDERSATEQRIGALRAEHADIVAATEGSNVDDEHDPEGATIAFERQQVDALVHQAEQRLVEIDAALDRLSGPSWGRCEVCGEQIPAERLAARPSATRCVACASR